MFKKLFLLFIFICVSQTKAAYAIENPLTTPNNKFGIHILFPNELSDAAQLVNSSGGDWGYVVIPIQSGDKDLQKWQKFMDDCRKYHLIPIIRLATEGDYFNTKVWRKPTQADVLDFANFLHSLIWPVKNRYVIAYNEVNNANEWGGDANPAEYTGILHYAVSAFKAKSLDFFIISAGMDNAAANTSFSLNEYTYLQQMAAANRDIFNQIDGLGSHSYPNPAFSTPPWVLHNESIKSFQFEKKLVQGFSNKDLPVFITETGWSNHQVDEETIAAYYKIAFATAWSDSSIVTVAPFLLRAGGEPFGQFSFYRENGSPDPAYIAIHDITKINGNPSVTELFIEKKPERKQTLAVRTFPKTFNTPLAYVSQPAKELIKWFLHL